MVFGSHNLIRRGTRAIRYNLRSGSYNHGAGAPAGLVCNATVNDVGGGRFEIVLDTLDQSPDDTYILVTAHDAEDVESPAGFDSHAVEIDRSQSICR